MTHIIIMLHAVATYIRMYLCMYVATRQEFLQEVSFLNLSLMIASSLMREL